MEYSTQHSSTYIYINHNFESTKTILFRMYSSHLNGLYVLAWASPLHIMANYSIKHQSHSLHWTRVKLKISINHMRTYNRRAIINIFFWSRSFISRHHANITYTALSSALHAITTTASCKIEFKFNCLFLVVRCNWCFCCCCCSWSYAYIYPKQVYVFVFARIYNGCSWSVYPYLFAHSAASSTWK